MSSSTAPDSPAAPSAAPVHGPPSDAERAAVGVDATDVTVPVAATVEADAVTATEISTAEISTTSAVASPSTEATEATTVATTAATTVAATTVAATDDLSAARDKLNALLDGIDSKSGAAGGAEEGAETQSPYEWRVALDPASNKQYYYNHRTNAVQWERPAAFADPPAAPAPAAAPDYTAVASFSSRNGAFSSGGTSSYWDQVGRANDREGRQMSTYFDMTSFEKNREDAKRKKEDLQNSGTDWKKYKDDKKQKKQRLTNKWLYEEEG
jgi:hypothetical protein